MHTKAFFADFQSALASAGPGAVGQLLAYPFTILSNADTVLVPSADEYARRTGEATRLFDSLNCSHVSVRILNEQVLAPGFYMVTVRAHLVTRDGERGSDPWTDFRLVRGQRRHARLVALFNLFGGMVDLSHRSTQALAQQRADSVAAITRVYTAALRSGDVGALAPLVDDPLIHFAADTTRALPASDPGALRAALTGGPPVAVREGAHAAVGASLLLVPLTIDYQPPGMPGGRALGHILCLRIHADGVSCAAVITHTQKPNRRLRAGRSGPSR